MVEVLDFNVEFASTLTNGVKKLLEDLLVNWNLHGCSSDVTFFQSSSSRQLLPNLAYQIIYYLFPGWNE